MDTMKNYFEYKCYTSCGIPKVKLIGTLYDWESIRDRAQALEVFNLEFWIKHLIPILDKFIAAYKGEADT